MKHFFVKVRHADSPEEEGWEEEYKRTVDDPLLWAKETVAKFNATLRRGELPRELLGVRIVGEELPEDEHNFTKQNIYSLTHAGRAYDIVKCERCGVTGKRYGVGKARLDSQFRAKVYQLCSTSVAHRREKGLIK